MTTNDANHNHNEMTGNDDENWEIYLFETEDGTVSNMVNLTVKEEYMNTLHHRCLVSATLLKPTDTGLSSKEEEENLLAIEDALDEFMTEHFDACYVGRSTSEGERTFCHYLKADNLPNEQQFTELLEQFAGYEFTCSFADDPDWDFYHQYLYPEPEDFHCINNRKVVENLIEHGDSLEEPRDTEHWIYFQQPEDRDDFKEEVLEMGFRVTGEDRNEDGMYGLSIIRKDMVDFNSIDDLVLELFALAREHEGQYDGWETLVIKEKKNK